MVYRDSAVSHGPKIIGPHSSGKVIVNALQSHELSAL